MARTSTKSKAALGKLIDLKPEEAAVLSLVAEYADVPRIKTNLVKALNKSTRRAKVIGKLILKDSKSSRSRYNTMAKRFVEASASNARTSRALKTSTLPGLLVSR